MFPQKQKDAKSTAFPENKEKSAPKKVNFPTLRLRLKPEAVKVKSKFSKRENGKAASARVTWGADTVDNEHLNRKKVCCTCATPGDAETLQRALQSVAAQAQTSKENAKGTKTAEKTTSPEEQIVPIEGQPQVRNGQLKKETASISSPNLEKSKLNEVPRSKSASKEPSSSRQRQVKFGDDVLESNNLPRGKPCCVHPKLFKDGTAPPDHASCRDHLISLTGIEDLLGINLAEYITDDQFVQMRQRIADDDLKKADPDRSKLSSTGSKREPKSNN